MSKESQQPQITSRAYYGRNILQSIIVLATNEISGVAEITPKAVKFRVNNLSLSVSVSVSLKYGHNAADVAFRIQENIKRSVESMTEYRVESVNVNVLSVFLDDVD